MVEKGKAPIGSSPEGSPPDSYSPGYTPSPSNMNPSSPRLDVIAPPKGHAKVTSQLTTVKPAFGDTGGNKLGETSIGGGVK
ncbi:hypothetical protein SLA2020_288900 [Shorea laevis]